MKAHLRVLPLVLGTLVFGHASAGTVDLSTAGYVQYGDALSYSLPANGLEVMSGPGQINLFTKVGLGANGQLGNGKAGMDDAYDTPQANNVDSFRMSGQSDPGGLQGAWDRAGWWDSTVGALFGALKGLPIFFFANNETGSNGSLLEDADASLAVWGRIEVTDAAGTVVKRYDMTNHSDNSGDPVGYGTISSGKIGGGDLLGDPANYVSTGAAPVVADFLMSGGALCLNASGIPVACDGSQGAVAKTVQHNLGGDRAAYAVVVPELNAYIQSLISGGENLDLYAIHLDVRLGCGAEGSFPSTTGNNGKTECNGDYALNGGNEKIFIGTADLLQPVPEPASLLLMGGALMSLCLVRRRKIR